MDASSDAINQSYDTIRAADSDSDGEVGGDVTIKSPQSTIVSINTKNDMQSPASHQVFEDNNLTSPVSNFSMGMTPSSNMSYDDRDELRTPSSALGLDDIAVSIAQHASPSSKNVRLENVRNLYRFYLHMKVPRSSTPVLLDTVTRLEEMESNVDTDFDTLQTLNIHELVFFEQIQSEKYLDVSKVCYKDHSKFHDHTNLFRVEKGINEQDFPVFDCNIELFDAAQMKFVSITEDLDYLWHIENDTFAFYTNIHHHPSKEDADVYLGLKIPFWWWKDHVLLPLMRIRNELNRDCALRDLILVQNPYLPLSQRLHYLYYKYLPCPRVITSPHRMSKSIIEISLYGFSTLLIYLPVSICIILIVILYSLCNLCCFGALERDREECSLEWLARQFGGNTTSGDAHSHNEAYDEVTAGNGNANRMEEGEGVSGQSGDTNTSTNRGSGRSYSRVDLDLEEINEEYTEPMSMQFREGTGNTFTTVSIKVKHIDTEQLDYSTLLTASILKKSEQMVQDLNHSVHMAIRKAKGSVADDDNGTDRNTSIVSHHGEDRDDVSDISRVGEQDTGGKASRKKMRMPIHLTSDEALIWASESDSLVHREEEMEVYRLYGADDTGKHKRLRIFDQVNSYFEIQIPK